jgi:Ser/Thr protein kinase RdoA (MazF antagonist)
VTVREFAEGVELDRDDPAQVRAAGATLALLHGAGEGSVERPSSSPWHAGAWPGDHDPPALHDPELDAWDRAFRDSERDGLARGVVHGDFYAGNFVWADGRVAAVIDWAEACLDVLARELAWATWEFGHDDVDQLDIDRARTFLGRYRELREPWEPGVADVLIPLMRVELRRNVRYSLPRPTEGEYSMRLQRAFGQLRRQSAAPLLGP